MAPRWSPSCPADLLPLPLSPSHNSIFIPPSLALSCRHTKFCFTPNWTDKKMWKKGEKKEGQIQGRAQRGGKEAQCERIVLTVGEPERSSECPSLWTVGGHAWQDTSVSLLFVCYFLLSFSSFVFFQPLCRNTSDTLQFCNQLLITMLSVEITTFHHGLTRLLRIVSPPIQPLISLKLMEWGMSEWWHFLMKYNGLWLDSNG